MYRNDPKPSLLARAQAYAANGIPVFPCVPNAKTPLTRNGFHDATTDPNVIAGWWTGYPSANIAMPTGAPGFDVLDVDVRPEGSGWQAMRAAKRAGLLEGWVRAVRTPSGGLHLHYRGSEQRNGSARGRHLDFRGRGGYVLLPHSQIRTPTYAGGYELIREQSGPGRCLRWQAVLDLIAAPRHLPSRVASRGDLSRLVDFVARQREGNRDNALFWAACRAAEAGHDPALLVHAAVMTGLPQQQANRTVPSALDTLRRQIGERAPRIPATAPAAPTR